MSQNVPVRGREADGRAADRWVATRSRLKQLRQERGWTQAKVRVQMALHAAAKGLPIASSDSLKAMYSGWENEHHRPDGLYQHLLSLVFSVPESELLGDPKGILPADDDLDDELRRRLLVSRTVDAVAVSLFQAQTDRLRLIDRKLGARAAATQMTQHLQTVQEHLQHTLLADVRRPMAAVLADAAALAGWQALDAGDTTMAWNRFETAKTAAREAGSTPLLAHAMAEQAYVLLDLRMEREAVELTEEARRVAGSQVPALLRSWLRAVEAEAHGSMMALGVCQRRFEEAFRHLPSGQDDPEMPYLMLSTAHLGRWRGNVLAKLGHAGAVDELRAVLPNVRGASARAEASLQTDLALALTTVGVHDEARAHAEQARKLIDLTGSVRLRRRLDSLPA